MSYYALQATIANGISGAFAVSFPYLSQADVHFYADEVEITSGITWNTSSQVTLDPVPAADVVILRRRITPQVHNPVTFSGGPIAAANLNLLQTVLRYGIQESLDYGAYYAGTEGGGGGGGGEGTTYMKALPDFGVTDPTNIYDNVVVFAAAEASDYERIYLPEGTYYTTTTLTDLKKAYYGPGKIRLADGSVLPGKFATITAPLTPYTVTGITGFFKGDTSQVDPQYFRIEPGLRIGWDERYYEPGYIPKLAWFTPSAGWSGRSGRLADAASIGATAIKVLGGVTGFVAGQTITVYDNANEAIFDTVTISEGGVNAGTRVITFSPALTHNYDANDFVTHGKRTWHGFEYVHVRNQGGGDAYGHIVRLQQNYVPLDSQLHFFDTSTVGQYGGDVVFTTEGGYATGWESQYLDQGHDVAVIAQVDSFVRTVDTGARSCVWLGTYLKSEGTAACDAAHVVSGGWRVGLDLVRADFSSNAQAAIQLATSQRIYLNGGVSAAGRGGDAAGVYTPFFGNVLGDHYITHGSDGSGEFTDLWQGGTYRVRLRETGTMSYNGTLNISNGVNVNGGNVSIADDLAIADGSKFFLNTAQSAWVEWDGTNIRVTKNGGGSYTNLV